MTRPPPTTMSVETATATVMARRIIENTGKNEDDEETTCYDVTVCFFSSEMTTASRGKNLDTMINKPLNMLHLLLIYNLRWCKAEESSALQHRVAAQ